MEENKSESGPATYQEEVVAADEENVLKTFHICHFIPVHTLMPLQRLYLES